MISKELRTSWRMVSFLMDQLCITHMQSWSQHLLQVLVPVALRRSSFSHRPSSPRSPSQASSYSLAKLRVKLFRKLNMNYQKNCCQLSKQISKSGHFFNSLTSHVCHFSFKYCTLTLWVSGGMPTFHSWKIVSYWLMVPMHPCAVMKSYNKLLLEDQVP